MEDRELIAKIKELKSISPDRTWVTRTKATILGSGQPRGLWAHWLKGWAFFTVPAMAAVLLLGAFVYNRIINSQENLSLDPAAIEAITTGLRMVETNVVEAIANLEKVKEPKSVLEIKQKMVSTIENGEKVVDAAKKMAGQPKNTPAQVLTAITGVENALKDMEEAYEEKQKGIAGLLIADLEKAELSEEQKIILAEAKKLYDKGNFSQALMKAIEVSQIK